MKLPQKWCMDCVENEKCRSKKQTLRQRLLQCPYICDKFMIKLWKQAFEHRKETLKGPEKNRTWDYENQRYTTNNSMTYMNQKK